MLGLKSARRAGLLGGTAMALVVAFGGGRAAFALDECGAGAPGGTVICSPAGNPYTDGIQYKVEDLTIVIDEGVIIDTAGGGIAPGGIVSGGAGNYGTLEIDADTNDGIVITTGEANAGGIEAATKDGGVLIYADGKITTSGADAIGITADAGAGNARVTWDGDIKTSGSGSHGILANSVGGIATIDSEGNIKIGGTNTFGLYAVADKYGASITHVGSITTTNNNAIAAKAISAGGPADILITGGITTAGNDSHGAYAYGKSVVNIDITGDVATSGNGANGIYAKSQGGFAVGSVEGSAITKGDNASAIKVVGLGAAQALGSLAGKIQTEGDNSHGIEVLSEDGVAGADFDGGTIATLGDNSNGIDLGSKTGDVILYGEGAISVSGKQSEGISVLTGGAGDITVKFDGEIETAGESGLGILATAETGDVAIVMQSGSIVTKGAGSAGIAASSVSGDIDLTLVVDVTTSDGLGINANTDGAITVSHTGDIKVGGDDNEGISLFSEKSTITLRQSGDIVTTGEDGYGLRLYAADKIRIYSSGTVTTSGTFANGINLRSKEYVFGVIENDVTTSGRSAVGVNLKAADDGKIAVFLLGDIHTSGKTADAVVAAAENGDVALQINGDVIATGDAAHGLSAASDKTVAIIINSEVQGGWNGGTGVLVGDSGFAGIGVEAGATIGALSDIAISDGKAGLFLNNSGTITGTAALGKGAEEFISAGDWNLRSFKDVDGDQQRDKEFVALIDFGADQDSFDNKGVLSLSNVSGATDWDTTGQILHPGGGNSDITQDGIEQGFLLGLETFAHSGLITLADGVAGDLLVITDQADGKTKGGNVFTSNGGALALDVVLDDGSSQQSDVLILDKAELGTGATQVLISNAGGLGGQTTGDGILVINVRDKSDAAAFTLGNKPVAGAYQYELVYQNQAKTDENWYLLSSFFDGSLEYPAIVSGVLESWHAGLGSLHDQIRVRRAQTEAQHVASQTAALQTATDVADSSTGWTNDGGSGQGGAGWLRVSGSDLDVEQAGPADFDLNTTRAEAGLDVGFDDLFGGEDWLVAGAFAGYGWSSLGFEGGSSADFDIATLGAYATYFRGPYYVDALVKLDWFDGNFNSDFVSNDNDISLPVFGFSLETGYRFDVTSQGLYLQPQAQLSYAHSGDDSFRDDNGAKIELDSADSLRGRLGARLGQEIGTTAGAAGEPVKGTFYLEASVNREFLGDVDAKVTGLTLEQDLPDTTFEIGGGIDIALPKDGVTFTVDADYTFGEDAEGVSATGGFRITW